MKFLHKRKALKKAKIFVMNEDHKVVHHSWEEAVKYYDAATGIFELCKDDATGYVMELDEHTIYPEATRSELPMTVKEAIKRDIVEIPAILTI